MKMRKLAFFIALAMASGLSMANNGQPSQPSQPNQPKVGEVGPGGGDRFKGVNSPPNTTTVTEQPVLGPAKKTDPALGRYRFSGTCEKVWMYGQKSAPVCDQFAGMIVMEAGKPQFFFPFKSAEKLWVFLAKGEVAREGNRVTYQVEKVFNKEFGVETPYEAGECVVDVGPNFECRVWRDKSRLKPIYEVIYKGNGNWQKAPLPTPVAPASPSK